MTAVSDANRNRARALAIFTRRMSAMIDVGVNLVCCLATLEMESSPPYDEAAKQLRGWIERGSTLSDALDRLPDLFPPYYRKAIKCGEIGGMLELYFADLADMLEDTLKLWLARGEPAGWAWLVCPGVEVIAREWAALSEEQKTLIRMLFCRSLGLMLSSGVPIKTAGEVAADFLPVHERGDYVRGFANAVRSGGRVSDFLESQEFASPLMLRVFRVGEEAGKLDIALQKVALAYQRELEIG